MHVNWIIISFINKYSLHSVDVSCSFSTYELVNICFLLQCSRVEHRFSYPLTTENGCQQLLLETKSHRSGLSKLMSYERTGWHLRSGKWSVSKCKRLQFCFISQPARNRSLSPQMRRLDAGLPIQKMRLTRTVNMSNHISRYIFTPVSCLVSKKILRKGLDPKEIVWHVYGLS